MDTLTTWGAGTYGGGSYGGVTVDSQPRFIVQAQLPDGSWRDLSCDVRSFSIDRGRSSWVEAFKAGTATVQLANFDGIYSTFPPSSVWLQPGGFVTDVPLRIGTTLNGDVQWRFTGTTDAVVDSWPGTTDALATVTATDGFKGLARHNGGPRTPAGAGELSGARILRLLADAGYSGGKQVDAGLVALQATDLNGVTLDLMRTTGEAEWGWLYVSGDGTLRFRQRDAQDTDPRMTTVQYVFADSDAIDGACYGEAVIASDSDRIVNVAQVTPPGHVLSSFSDAPSMAWFGPRTWTRTDLPINTDVDAAGLAQLVVLQQAADDQRIDAVTIDGAHRAHNFEAAHGVRITDRIRFIRTIPGGHQLDAELLVLGRKDDVTAAGEDSHAATWQVTLATASAALINALGAWDDGTWDDSQWGV